MTSESSEKWQIVLPVFLNKLSKNLKLGWVTRGLFSMHPFDNSSSCNWNHKISNFEVDLCTVLFINFVSTLKRWRDENWPHKSWSLKKLSRSTVIFSRQVSFSSLLMYVVVGRPCLPSLPSVGVEWTRERIGGFWKYFCPDFGFKARF